MCNGDPLYVLELSPVSLVIRHFSLSNNAALRPQCVMNGIISINIREECLLSSYSFLRNRDYEGVRAGRVQVAVQPAVRAYERRGLGHL